MAKTRYNLLRLHQGARFLKNGIYCSFPKFRTTDDGIGSRNNLSERVDTFLEGLCFRIAENAGYFGVPGAKEAQIQSFEKRQAHQLQ